MEVMEPKLVEPGGEFEDVDIKSLGSESIKLFIGQIPRSWEEDDVRQILEPFGAIQELSILRDRTTGVHKGRADLI